MNWLERRESWKQQTEDARKAGDVDYARVIHSASFRRLQGKTQILNLGDSDFYRTRLTHSLEVAQIAGGLTLQLANNYGDHPVAEHLPYRSLVQAIGCTHDLGHPPFGHGGEVALNYCMRDNGGFEGNGQTLRILTRLENFSESAGANLSRRTLLGVLKYPVPYSRVHNPECAAQLDASATSISIIDSKKSKPPKCYLDSEEEVVNWILEPLPGERETFQSFREKAGKHYEPIHKSLDCSIMDVADDVSYGVHDLEDAVAMGLLKRDDFTGSVQSDRCSSFLDALKEKYPRESGNDVYGHFVTMLFGDSNRRKRCISRLVHHFITAIEVVEYDEFTTPLLKYRARLKTAQRDFLEALKSVVFDRVIRSPSVQHLEFKGQQMVVAVFEAMQSDPKRLLPRDAFEQFEEAESNPRVICDYIAGMTDSYLLRIYERLFSPRMGSVFDKL